MGDSLFVVYIVVCVGRLTDHRDMFIGHCITALTVNFFHSHRVGETALITRFVRPEAVRNPVPETALKTTSHSARGATCGRGRWWPREISNSPITDASRMMTMSPGNAHERPHMPDLVLPQVRTIS